MADSAGVTVKENTIHDAFFFQFVLGENKGSYSRHKRKDVTILPSTGELV